MSESIKSSSTSFLARQIDAFLTASWLPSIFRCEIRTGKIQCPCGAVEIALNVPPSSYALVEQTNAICHCSDCTNFRRACPNGDAVKTENNGTFMINFYKSDLHVTKGRDKIQGVRLHVDSPLIRTYCGQCHTPLGADVPVAPICLVNERLLHCYSVVFLPSIVLAYNNQKDGVNKGFRPYARSVVVRRMNFGPVFLFKTITRAILGLLMGKSRGGMLENDYKRNFPVGLESLKKQFQGNK